MGWLMLGAAIVVAVAGIAAQAVYRNMNRAKELTPDELHKLRIDVALLGDAVERLRAEVDELKRAAGRSSTHIKEP
jgi:uncharacterized protein YlxW (UPF0749 family)